MNGYITVDYSIGVYQRVCQHVNFVQVAVLSCDRMYERVCQDRTFVDWPFRYLHLPHHPSHRHCCSLWRATRLHYQGQSLSE